MAEERQAPATVHRLRAFTLVLDAAGAAFAARNGLSATDVRALVCLLDRERAGVPASPTWLAGQLRVTTASVTALLDRLERAGHVRRMRDDRDRRRLTLHRAESATALLNAFSEPLDAAMDAIVVGYDCAELDIVQRFLGDAIVQVSEYRRSLVEW